MTATSANQQSVESLPVYRVTRTGLNKGEAEGLAKAFGVPVGKMTLRDGVVTYVDRERYLKVPMNDIDDADEAEMLRAMSAAAPEHALAPAKNRL